MTNTDKDKNEMPSPVLLRLLVCPVTRGPLHYDKEKQQLINFQAKRAYPIQSGVPLLCEAHALPME